MAKIICLLANRVENQQNRKTDRQTWKKTSWLIHAVDTHQQYIRWSEFRCRWSQDLEQSPVLSALSQLVHWTVQTGTEDVSICVRRGATDFFA